MLHLERVDISEGLAHRDGVSAADLLGMDFPPIRYVVEGYIVEGVTLLAGPPKVGKSYMALGVALAVAGRQLAFGSIPCDGGDVLYLALEDNLRRLKRRLLQMGLADAPARLTFMTNWPTLDDGCIDEIEAWADKSAEPRLVIVDVLARVRAFNCSDRIYEADYRTLSGLQALAGALGLAVVVIHHTRKMPSDDPFDSVSGTRGLTGAADSVLVLKRDTGTAGANRVSIYGRGRDITEIETVAEFNCLNGTFRIIGEAHEVARTCERQVILDELRSASKSLTAREISDLSGKNYATTRRTLARMAKAGEIEKTSRGQYACLTGPIVPSDDDGLERDIGTVETARPATRRKTIYQETRND